MRQEEQRAVFTTRIRLIAVVLAFALPVQPVVALPFLSQRHTSVALAMLPACADLPPMSLPCSALMPITLVPIGVVPSSAFDEQRGTIAGQLVELGYAAEVAQQMASELTPNDLAVLLGNPKMMQKAGEMDELTKNVIWALVIAGIVVAIVIAADGSISIN
jgi:hypothetical protein